MAKNEFLPFGVAANANVIPNIDYQVLPARASGFVGGVAKSEELNTVWRQCSVMASVLAQFIADNTGNDALDNGDLVTLQNNLGKALKAYAENNFNFGNLLSARGYQKLPSNNTLGGLIIQWGTITGTIGQLSGNYPITFPNMVLQATVSLADKDAGSNSGISLYVENQTFGSRTSLTVQPRGSDGAGNTTARFIAIGF
ncbi:gp53-like domain-containing protein [Serratia liquefaciens]|uniref:gp53-like domain-containing protein n=1 Tax=Serratia liquefaciens TaxID=614 RepID=UPI0022B99CB4|nr:hypothetical protein [Serratia liquefaciens]